MMCNMIHRAARCCCRLTPRRYVALSYYQREACALCHIKNQVLKMCKLPIISGHSLQTYIKVWFQKSFFA